jgi:DsbC/DsbD-like thiol-disulfide interchange protein
MARLLDICACLLVLVSGCARSTPKQTAHSKASLVIEQSATTSGSQVNLGIQFVTDSGWHIYWQNPGDSGEPPRIQWQLPAGVTAGELEWPTPMRLTTSAGTDFGYQGTTVLLSSLQVPTTPLSGTITVGGDLRWLVCHDICVPQSTHLEAPIRIAIATSINDSAHQLLQSAAQHLPTPLPASYRPEAASSLDSFRLTLVSSEPITRAEFFPRDEAQIDNGAPQELASHADKVSLTLKKSEYLRQQPQHLQGVLVLNGRDAYLLDAPIHSSATQQGSREK